MTNLDFLQMYSSHSNLQNYKVEIPELQGQLHIMALRIPTVGLVPEDLAPKCHVEPQERLRVTV